MTEDLDTNESAWDVKGILPYHLCLEGEGPLNLIQRHSSRPLEDEILLWRTETQEIIEQDKMPSRWKHAVHGMLC